MTLQNAAELAMNKHLGQLDSANELSQSFVMTLMYLQRLLIDMGETAEHDRLVQHQAFLHHMHAMAALVNATSEAEERIRSMHFRFFSFSNIPEKLLAFTGLGSAYWRFAPAALRVANSGPYSLVHGVRLH